MPRFALPLLLLVSVAAALAQVTAPTPAQDPAAPLAAASSPAVSGASSTAAVPASGAPRVTFSRCNVDGPYLAMTFDDGPSAANTPRLLDLAARKHIKLTFFLIGENARANPQLVQRELAEGHQVGNHSYTHPDLAKMTDDAVRAEIQKTQDAIIDASGYRPILMRPPYGALSARQRLWVARDFSVKIILWDVDPLDWKRPGPAVVASRIIAATRPGSIILTHDIHSQTVDAKPQVFDTLLAKGFKFVTVSELLAMDRGPAHAKKSATQGASQPAQPAAPVAAANPPSTAAAPPP